MKKILFVLTATMIISCCATKKEEIAFIVKLLKMDYGCVKKRFEDAIYDNPELIKEEEK